MIHRTASRTQLILACLAITALCSCSDVSDTDPTSTPEALQGDSESGLAMLEMPGAAHFMMPDGTSTIVARGIYEVAGEEASLRLVPDDDTLPPIHIIAESLSHDENLGAPTADAYAGESVEDADVLEIALLLPDGTYFSAMGSISGVSSRGLLDRAKNRQAMRKTNQQRRVENRNIRQANRAKPGINIGENLANRVNVVKENSEERQSTRQDNREDRREQFGLGGNTIPEYRDGAGAFNSFDYTANGESMTNTYLLSYLATLIYPDFLVEVDPDNAPRGICNSGPCKDQIKNMHARGNDEFNTSNLLFLDNFADLTRQLFTGRSEFTWVHGYENRAKTNREKSNLNYDPEAMVISTRDAVFVVFRGTDALDGAGKQGEWISTNFYAAPEAPGLGLPGLVQYGFWNSLKAPAKVYTQSSRRRNPLPVQTPLPARDPVAPTEFEGEFRRKLESAVRNYGGDTKPVWITGHSLGGAHAQLFAAFLNQQGIEARGVYVFESPQVGNVIFASFLNNTFGNRLQRFDFKTDPVTRLPMRFARPGARVFARNVNDVKFDSFERRADFVGGPIIQAAAVLESLCFHYPHWGLVAAYNQLSDDEQNNMPSHLGTPWTEPVQRDRKGFQFCNAPNVRAGNGT